MGALTMLNENGDTTLVWTPDRDDEMEKIIQKKMDEGCTFFMIEPRFGTRTPLKRAGDANQHRMIAIPDEDMLAFVSSGKGEVVKTPPKKAKPRGRAKSAKEAAQGESVGVRPRAGG